MKVWSNYLKEMKIASRGFYFYMEIVVAVVFLVALLFLVPETAVSKQKELLYLDMPQAQIDMILENWSGQGQVKKIEDTEFKLSPATLVYYDEATGQRYENEYTEKKTLSLDTYEYFDQENGENSKTIYLVDNFDDLLRVSYVKKWYGSTITFDEQFNEHYQTILSGSETDRYLNLISSVYAKTDQTALLAAMDAQNVRYLGSANILNNRQSYIPLVVIIMNGLMGMMIVIAYISVDKGEGLIKAMSVSPVKTRGYLMSKILVVMTISILSSLVITIPVMKLQPNYPLFMLTAFAATFMSCIIGLLVSSFFSDMKASFGFIIVMTVAFMLPAFTQILPSFDPLWARFIPTYYMLEALKETLLPSADVPYVLLTVLGMVVISIPLFLWAESRYRKTLGV